MPYYPIKTQEDLDYYLSHISIMCKAFLEEKFNKYSWKFDSFNNQSTNIQEPVSYTHLTLPTICSV